MANKTWCSDIYDLNSSNTSFTYEHDLLYREYAATSIGDLIDKMQDHIDKMQDHIDTLQGKLDEIKEIL